MYETMHYNEDDAITEFQRMLDDKYALAVPASVWHDPKSGLVHRMSIITKNKAGQSEDFRIVVDMRRSGANKRASIPERPIFPRPLDAIQDDLDIMKPGPVN